MLLGRRADKVMRELFQASDGKFGSAAGYRDTISARVPSNGLCKECTEMLDGGGVIFVAKDTGEYLRLRKEEADHLVGRIGDAKGRVLDIDSMRGKTYYLPKAFWVSDGQNIRLRDPAEWSDSGGGNGREN
jgi:hypothetical protein